MKKLIKYINSYKKSGLVLLDQGLVSGTSFITGVLLTRFLGLDTYGVFVLLWMLVLFGLSVSQTLITKPLMSLEPKMEKSDSDSYLASLHCLQLGLSLLIILLSIIGLSIFSLAEPGFNIDIQTTIGLSFATGLIIAYDYYRKYFFLKGDLVLPLISDAILALFQIGGILILYFLGLLSIANFLLLICFNYSIVCIIGYLKNVKPDFNTEKINVLVQQHFDFSKWLLGTVLAQWLNGNFFILCAGGILGAAVVGAVRIAQNVIGLTHVIFLAMENVVPVSAAQAFKNGGEKKLFGFLKNISLQIGWLVMSILILISIFSPDILSLLYGEEFAIHSYILIGFCIIYLLVYIGYPLRFALRTLEMTKPIFTGYVLGAAFSLISAVPLLNYWGVYGLLIGIFVTQLISQLAYVFSLWKIKKYYENHSLGAR